MKTTAITIASTIQIKTQKITTIKHYNIQCVLIVLWVFITITETTPTFDGNGKLPEESGLKISLLKGPERTRESVNLEKESIQSKIKSVYDNAQQKTADNIEVLPIVDTITEDEKYGNNGDQFDGVSRGIINGYEAFSNFLNFLIEKPKEIFRSLSKGLTNQLDIVGGKLVGL